MYRYIFSKGLLCLLNNMLTEEVCVVSYDHHYDSLVKQKCKDRHWSTRLSPRGQSRSLWETCGSAVHQPSVLALLLTWGSWQVMPLSLPQENLQAQIQSLSESLLHSHSLDMPSSSNPDSHWKLNPDPPASCSNLNNQGTSASQQVQHSQRDRQKAEVCLFPLPVNFQSPVFPPVFSFLSYGHLDALLEQLWRCAGTRGIKWRRSLGEAEQAEKKRKPYPLKDLLSAEGLHFTVEVNEVARVLAAKNMTSSIHFLSPSHMWLWAGSSAS